MQKRILGLIQSRLTASRLPEKALKKIGEFTAVELMYERIKRSRYVSEFIFLIPDTPANDPLYDYLVHEIGYKVVRGDENDVLARYIKAASLFDADYYLRLTADCPFSCPEIIDSVCASAMRENADYASNVGAETFADGLDVECLTKEALFWTDAHIKDPHKREHVTLGLRTADCRETGLKIIEVKNPIENQGHIRITLDTPEDLEAMNMIANYLTRDDLLSKTGNQIASLYEHLNLRQINGKFARNEGIDLSRRNY